MFFAPPAPAARRWHYEMAQINVVLRTLVRIMYGTALAPGTRQDALASFKRAAELAPERLIHRWAAWGCRRATAGGGEAGAPPEVAGRGRRGRL